MRHTGWFCFLVLILSSCFENEYLDDLPISEIEVPFDIKKVEKTDITFSTFLEDSIPTSGKETFLLGNYSDPYRGHVVAEPYFEFELNTLNTSFEDYHAFDSLVFSIKLSDYHYDTAAVFPLSVYEITESIEYIDDKDYIYNYETFNRGREPLVTAEKRLYPSDSTLTITLPYDFGNNLWLQSKGSSSIMTTTEDFRDALKGLSLVAEGTSPLITFTKDSYLTFYYHNDDDMEPGALEYQIPIGDLSMGFTHMEVNLDQTPFSGLGSYEILPASESQNLAISDELSGASIRIEIGNVKDIAEVDYEYHISEANLFIPIKKGTYSSVFNPLAQKVDVYVLSANKKIKSYLTTASLASWDEVFQEATYYKIPIIDFVEDMILDSETGEGLVLDIYPESSLTTGYLVAGENSERYRTRLEITIIPLN